MMNSRRVRLGALFAVVGLVTAATTAVVVGPPADATQPTVVTTTTIAATKSIGLHNNTAGAATDCPAGGAAYWHFVLAPNNGSSAFVSITLHLASDVVTFSGAQIIKNGSQSDNVFVAVPAGHTLTDLVVAGSSATYTGSTPNKFNLSSTCECTTGATTTSTVPGATTTTTTTVVPGATTTTGPATVLGATATQTPSPSQAEVLGSTANRGVSGRSLAITGSDSSVWIALGAALLAFGAVLTISARRRRGLSS